MRIVGIVFLFVSTLFGSMPQKKQWEEYLQFLDSFPSDHGFIGDSSLGEIEILKDPWEISLAMRRTMRDVGIVYQDRYWMWLNDPVRFPSGIVGVYGRILSKSSLKGVVGAAVFPLLEDGQIALLCNFRHATRSWELEIPRGFAEKTESAQEAAKRELLEETGLVAKELVLLGEMAPDTGKSCSTVPIFLAKVEEQKEPSMEDSEAIASIMFFSKDELADVLKRGFLLAKVRGVERKIFLRDPFLTFALVQMELKGLFSWGDRAN